MNAEWRIKNAELRMRNAEFAPSTSDHLSGVFIIHHSSFCIRSFTLVELMVVVVLLGILATIVTVSVNDYLVKGKQSAAKTEISQMKSALELYYSETDHYPSNDEGLALLTKASPSHPHGVLQGSLQDPWGHDYIYIYPGIHGAYDICSYGANGQEGGTGADMDICSWNEKK